MSFPAARPPAARIPFRLAGAVLFGALLMPRPAVAGGDDARNGRTAAERRRVETLRLGRPSTVHRLIREGPTAAQLRSAGGDERPATLLHPIPGARIGRGHGSGTNGYHEALDIIADEGTPILAAEAGLVVYTGDELSGFGGLVVLLHPGGWLTYYAHCSGYLVRPGQKVARGRRIALVGNTGISRGPHLHFVLWMEGDQVDPYPFFRPAPGVPRSGPLPHVAHRVRRGDTPASVAERHGVTAAELRAANHLAADRGLQVGWQLIVPRRMESRPAEEEPAPGAAEDGTCVVRSGDTLSEIAERYALSVDDLARWNDLLDPSRIRTGMTLVLRGEDVVEDPAAGEGNEAASAETPAASVPAAAAVVPEPEASPVRVDTYVVRSGDTLSEIAGRLGIALRELVQANALVDVDRLRVGQALRVPDVGGGPPGEAVSPDGSAPPDAFAVPYRVRDGDSLWTIARRFGTSLRRIRELNPGLDAEGRLRAGQRLLVPQEERR